MYKLLYISTTIYFYWYNVWDVQHPVDSFILVRDIFCFWEMIVCTGDPAWQIKKKQLPPLQRKQSFNNDGLVFVQPPQTMIYRSVDCCHAVETKIDHGYIWIDERCVEGIAATRRADTIGLGLTSFLGCDMHGDILWLLNTVDDMVLSACAWHGGGF